MPKKPVPKSGSSKALYRKYRPTSLDTVVGQEQVTTPLKNSVASGKISHAYLFIGPRGTGKTSVARILAHAINNFDYQLEDSYLDIIEIDAASNTGVDNIRELREKAIIAPTSGKYKVYIIDEVHMLSKSAANALLKTLEEPPEHVIFIMATTEANKVPITISSRTEVFTFRLADPEVMFAHLRKISDLEKIPIDDDALRLLIRRGGGSFRDSLSLLGQIATLTSERITKSLLEKSLGLPSDELVKKLLDAYRTANISKLQETLRDLLNSGLSPENIAGELINAILAVPDPALFPLLEKLPTVEPPFPEAKLLLALCANVPQPASTPVPMAESKKPPVPKSPKTPAQSPDDAFSEASEDPAPQPAQAPSAPAEPKSFSWEDFLETIRIDHETIFSQLKRCDYKILDGTLHIYPPQKFALRVLKKPENSQVLAESLAETGLALLIHDLTDSASPKDTQLAQLSAIMGEEVREVNGDMPF